MLADTGDVYYRTDTKTKSIYSFIAWLKHHFVTIYLKIRMSTLQHNNAWWLCKLFFKNISVEVNYKKLFQDLTKYVNPGGDTPLGHKPTVTYIKYPSVLLHYIKDHVDFLQDL